MKFILEIECDNDAFAEHPGHEVGAILRGAAIRSDLVDVGYEFSSVLRDSNGNKVGTAHFIAS